MIFDGNNILVLNPSEPLNISGNGKICDDELQIAYKDNHIFEISFDPKKVSVVLAAEQTPIRERNRRG